MAQTHIRVQYDEYRHVTRDAYPDDSWDRGDTAADICIHAIEIVPERMYRDITVPFEVLRGKKYYLLWADYDTGDSFGRDENQVEFIDLFETVEDANTARDALLGVKGYNGTYIRQDGTKITVHIPWYGYFEHLNSINITPVYA